MPADDRSTAEKAAAGGGVNIRLQADQPHDRVGDESLMKGGGSVGNIVKSLGTKSMALKRNFFFRWHTQTHTPSHFEEKVVMMNGTSRSVTNVSQGPMPSLMTVSFSRLLFLSADANKSFESRQSEPQN